MTAFDSVLVAAIVSCVVSFVGICAQIAKRRKESILRIFVVLCALVLSIIVLCLFAYHYEWESTILDLPKSTSPGPVDVKPEDNGTPEPSTMTDTPSLPVIIATAELAEPFDINKELPRLNQPKSEIYSDETYFEITWPSFKEYTQYEVYVYERDGENYISLYNDIVDGNSYSLDMRRFERGKTYSVNISVEHTYFSTPLLIEMKP